MKKPELLAPAGDFEKLKMAIIYGADSVYVGGKNYSLRAGARNFEREELEKAVDFVHRRDKKIYVTLNIFPHNSHLIGIDDYIIFLDQIGVDAVIISDAGILSTIREVAPDMEIHLSTQANTLNWKSAHFWYEQGIDRIIMARELSLEEISYIRKKLPQECELEVFVHGAMCISYSGRCLISNYLAGRDSNLGECAHPCRWKYYLMEEKRQREYYPIMEDEEGTYFFNSKDLCMIEYLPELIHSGVNTFKIEGRMKSAYYVATVVNAYRRAIDQYFESGGKYTIRKELMEELQKVSHREFTTGFYFGRADDAQVYSSSSYIRDYEFVGLIIDYDNEKGIATVEQRNRFFKGDTVEIFGPGADFFEQTIDEMTDQDGNPIDSAPHPQQIVKIPVNKAVQPFFMIRKSM
ncbi:MAG: U32 family peptidase [Clostridia bacterium]|nr:U32 family peptidase [Clostridia bacterium]